MSESPPPAKRIRLDSGDCEPTASSTTPLAPPPLLADLKRHDEFWIDDGNLILIANQDTAFRVYRGLLTTQSTVFADMLAASDPTRLVDGCPVLNVSDTPIELSHFLGVMLPKSQLAFQSRLEEGPRLSMTFDQVAAIVRLAHKYKIEDVRTQGLRILQLGHYAIDYMAWQHRDIHPSIRVEKANAIGALKLARLIGEPSLLPMAVYGCVRLGSAVLDGWKRDDGVVEQLTQADLKYCMDVRHALARKSAIAFARAFKWEDSYNECTTPNRCRARLRVAKREVFTEYFAKHLILDDWYPPADLETLLDEHGICGSCVEEFSSRDYSQRKEVWVSLPDVLGIEIEGWGYDKYSPY